MLDFWKSHIKGHIRGNAYVRPHERAGGASAHIVAHDHPEPNDKGQPVLIKHPTHPSSHDTWGNPDAVATFVPCGDVPMGINGVQFHPWRDHPVTSAGWDYVDGVNDNLVEPPLKAKPGKSLGAGVVIEELDGRVWLTAPTNEFGGYKATYPKGTVEGGLSLQANAIKEAFEETGLKIEITGFIGDFERTTSVARMYRARRVGGTPVAMGWESQAVHLCPRGMLYELLNGWADHPVAEMVGAGPAPVQKKSPPKSLF
jgi:ADP-ribose pyrophosphatase YjhB (NUDIX family)